MKVKFSLGFTAERRWDEEEDGGRHCVHSVDLPGMVSQKYCTTTAILGSLFFFVKMLYYYLLVVLSVEYQNRPRLVINKKSQNGKNGTTWSFYIFWWSYGHSVCFLAIWKKSLFQCKKKHNSTLLFHFLLLFGLIFYFRTYRISKSVVRMNKNQSQWYTGSRDATQGPTLVHFTISLRIHPGKRIWLGKKERIKKLHIFSHILYYFAIRGPSINDVFGDFRPLSPLCHPFY